MKLRFVDKVKILDKRYRAAYFSEIRTIEIDRHLPWINKLECLLHEIPHVANDILFGGLDYLDFMWDVFDCLLYLPFDKIAKTLDDIARTHKHYFGRKWKFEECVPKKRGVRS